MQPPKIALKIEKLIESKFFILLLSLIFLILLLPYLSGTPIGNLIIGGLYIIISLALVYALRKNKIIRTLFLFLIFASIFIKVIEMFLGHPNAFKIIQLFIFTMISLIALTALFHEILRTKRVTRDTIFCSIIIYLLIGITYASIYHFIEIVAPGSFRYADAKIPLYNDFHFLYFSFITLTTTGFGDMIAVTLPAKSIVILESVTGIFYIAVLVARLVGALKRRP